MTRKKMGNAAESKAAPSRSSAAPAAPSGMIIALTSLKGGVGKTTLAMHLAAAIAQERSGVVVLDADEEISAVRWKQHAAADQISLPFGVVAAERNTLMRQARELAKRPTPSSSTRRPTTARCSRVRPPWLTWCWCRCCQPGWMWTGSPPP